MSSVLKLLVFTMVASLVAGCATSSDIENLQSQIDGLKTSTAQALDDAKGAQEAAAEASAKASAAEMSANRAAELSQEVNTKLDNMFKKSMEK